MIHGISGKTGGGKSYEAVVRHIIPIITIDKRKVVTNLPLDIDHFCSVYGEYCRDLIEVIDGDFHSYGGQRPFSKAEHYLQYENWKNDKGQGVYFFIDECHLALPKGQTDKAVEEFYSMHRHYGFDIMLITQNFRKVSLDIKDLVGNHYRAIKKSMMGQDDKYILKVHDGASNTNNSVVATHEREYESKYFKFYKSHTKSDTAIKEAASNDIEKWYKHWSFKGAIVCVLLFMFIVGSQLSKDEKKNKAEKKVSNSSVVVESVGSVVPGSSLSAGTNQSVPIVKNQKSIQQLEYEEMVSKSSDFHPYYKMNLSVSGSATYTDSGYLIRVVYISASQNGQHVFTIKNSDLIQAGYQVQVLSECAVYITYYDYKDYLTCNTPQQSTGLSGDTVALNN